MCPLGLEVRFAKDSASRPIRPVPFELPRAASRAGDCLERQDVDGGKRLASASCQPRRFETLDPWEEGTRTGR